MEAQRVISVSLGKIAQSRVQRSGCSLHKSLMVASILQKARHVYVEQAFMMHCRPAAPVAAPVSPPAPTVEPPTYTDLDACSPAERGASEATDAEPARRKRLISDEETEEAVASILPKRARVETDLAEDLAAEVAQDLSANLAAEVSAELAAEEAPAEAKESESSKDIDSDDSDDSCYESGDSDDNETEAMDIDRITSLVSVFSFDGMKMRAASEPCARDWECASDAVPVRA